jgi:glutathione peroxidase
VIYSFQAVMNNGEEVSLQRYAGKVLLIVNTASRCGFTPQYAELQRLYEKYRERGLEILGFPCNQFANQEPGGNEEIAAFCSLQYGVTFPIFAKIEVNGKNAHPLFKYLKRRARGFLGTTAVKWNFTKFLVDREGRVVRRYAPNTKPSRLEQDIVRLLAG